jgi:hypothetical protein
MLEDAGLRAGSGANTTTAMLVMKIAILNAVAHQTPAR